MTNQEIFDKVLAHLEKQNGPAFVDSDRTKGCAYKNAVGLKCAVGCLIPDELYVPEIEGAAMGYMLEFAEGTEARRALKKILDEIGILPEQYDLLSALQAMHDNKDPVYWEEVGAEVAEKYGLKHKGDDDE